MDDLPLSTQTAVNRLAVTGFDTTNSAQQVVEQLIPGAEDNTNGVIYVTGKSFVGLPTGHTQFTIPNNDVDYSAKATPGNLLWITCTNANAAVRYLQIHNKTSAPSSGNTAYLSVSIPAGGSVTLGPNVWGEAGLNLSTGVAIGVSTAHGTFTAATTTDHFITGAYV